MKKLLPLLVSLFPLAATAQVAPGWASATSLPITPAFAIQPSYAVDAAGNTYLAATFRQSITLAPSTALTSQDSQFGLPSQDGVIAKYSPTGSLLWYRQLSSAETDSFQKVIIDASGKVVLLGLAGNGAQLGTTTFSTSAFGSVLTLTQLDAQGQVQYIREIGDATLMIPASLASDAAGNYYVSGTFGLDATFGSFSLSTITSTGYGLDQFVAKVSAAGAVQWAQQGGRVQVSSTGTATALSHLVADPSGNVYLVWTTAPTAGGFGTVSMPAAKGDYDGLVVKYDTQGAPQWAQRVGGAGADIATYAGLDSNGRLVVPGFSAPAGALASPATVASTVATTGFVTVLDPTAGAAVWSRDLQATMAGAYRSMTADASGNIYLAGHFKGQGAVPGKSLLGTSSLDALIVSYSSNGTLRWTQQSSGTGDEIPVSIALDGTNRLVVPGIFNNGGLFGSTALTSTATAANTGTPFVAYLGSVVTATRTEHIAPLALYPNPAPTATTVHLPALPVGTQVTLTDGLGRATHCQPTGTTLPLAGLAPGLYVVQATAPSGERWTSRLVVE
ncbi:T9SS type A sorting domain-containing protein [Hymenobacter setariae]|uniref:T9SS type A sorting domain-containing protein n=1 Tax=Hymenobacter setariae TaxID=2594794 RepID=A0A558BPR7_9BACT|nr:T9SS type A sorting domain-containing protein [Hymenobacter setariae]TVT38514.1 T9SS type A sorting domain-containing protein [Hymenobacter setariae]